MERAAHVAVVIPTKNEQRNIAETIMRAQKHFSRIVVVDSASTDDTVAIARELGATVVAYEWDGKYPKKKQWCLDNVAPDCPWVLFLDGDEQLSDELAQEIVAAADTSRAHAWDVELTYTFLGRALQHGYVVRKRVLLHRATCRYPAVDDLAAPGMGEQEGHYQPIVEGPVGTLTRRLLHHDQDPVTSWFARHNRYSDWEAWLHRHPDVRATVRSLKTRQGRLFDRLPFKSVLFFLYCYLVKQGFRDGRAGFHYALALSFYRWQIHLKSIEPA
jgi:glycosyltransferase involved in cell wall biosynthesis